jgi:two-component system nitrogen regulation sensor histidine kinase GlnL
MTNGRPNLAQSGDFDARELLNHCVTGFARLDADCCFVWINPALTEWLGSVARRMQGSSIEVIDAGNSGLLEAARRAQKEDRRMLLREARIRAGAEGESVADLTLTPLNRGELLLEVQPVSSAGAAGSPALSESLRGFAHEVKNPLAGVRGAAQLIGRRVESPELLELAELIIGESDRLAGLADRLLHAGGKPQFAERNVHELLERIAALISAEPASPSIRRDYDPSLPLANVDADRLYQLLLNLVRNALEAGAHSITLRTRVEFGVRLGDSPRRYALRIEVLDDGRGVPPELASTLYQPLVSGRSNGTGLGLALAQEIANEHGGELRHSSRPGATSFVLLLPLDSPT